MINERESIIGLNLVSDIAMERLKKLLRVCDTHTDIFNLPQEILSSCVGEKTALGIKKFNEQLLAAELSDAKKQGVLIITYLDEEYPQCLKTIYSAPIVLYVKGDVSCLSKPGLAVVGTRVPTLYGMNCATHFSQVCAQYGLLIISGLARGIDTCAHTAALQSNGKTVAVLGSGFNHLYPADNCELAHQISCSGCVVSEFAMNTIPRSFNFPRRNRIISGLSSGVLVVEAGMRSGALITADYALEQGKLVFAIPGKIDNPLSNGTNMLIQQGAIVVLEPQDICDEFTAARVSIQNRYEPEMSDEISNLSAEEKLVYEHINSIPCLIDEICQKVGMDIPKLSAILVKLEVAGMICRLAQQRYIRSMYA